MGKDAFEFLVIQQLQDSLSDCDGRMLWVASSSEGIRRIGWNHIHLGHGDTDFLGQAHERGVSARKLFARDGLSAIHGQSDLVGIEVGDEVHDDGNEQRQEHSALAAEIASDEHQKQRQSGEQERGLKSVSHSRKCSLSHWMMRREGSCSCTLSANCWWRTRSLLALGIL